MSCQLSTTCCVTILGSSSWSRSTRTVKFARRSGCSVAGYTSSSFASSSGIKTRVTAWYLLFAAYSTVTLSCHLRTAPRSRRPSFPSSKNRSDLDPELDFITRTISNRNARPIVMAAAEEDQKSWEGFDVTSCATFCNDPLSNKTWMAS